MPRIPIGDRPDIVLPDGRVLRPERRFAGETTHTHQKTVARMGLPSVEIGGVKYIDVSAALQAIGDRVRRRNEPARRSRVHTER